MEGKFSNQDFDINNIMNQKTSKSHYSLLSRMNSLRHALRGLLLLFTNEANARIHLFAGTIVLIMGLVCRLNQAEWLSVIISIGLVLFAEAVNTSIEYLADVVCPEKNQKIGAVKDVAAASVLIAAVTAIIIGSIVFIPHILNFIS